MTANTKIWRALEPGGRERAVAEAARMLRDGGIVAFPTETVYGLGADAADTAAVERIFAAKGRPADNPLIVHIADTGQLDALVLPYGELAGRLMERFWPGPLTLVLPVRPGAVSPRVTAGLDTVALRMPHHDLALRLIAEAGRPIAAPSANSSGRPSPTEAAHVIDDLNGRIDGIVDGGPTGVGVESTVVEIAGPGSVRILRPGGVTAEQLRETADEVLLDPALGLGLPSVSLQPGEEPSASWREDEAAEAAHGAPRSPGMKYAHYAPRGVMELVQGEPSAVRAYILEAVEEARRRGERTGVLTYEERAAGYDADAVIVCGSLARLETAARRLYGSLREFDARGIDRIWAEACPQTGIGLALLNRLAKAAAHRIVRV